MAHFLRSSILNLGLLACFILLSLPAQTQPAFGIKGSFMRPSGEYGRDFHGSPGIDLVLRFGELDEEINSSFSIGYYAPRPRKDSIDLYDTSSENGQVVLIAIKRVYESYSLIPISYAIDFSANDFPVNPTLGVEASAFLVLANVEEYIGTNSILQEKGVKPFYTIAPRIGAKYQANEKTLFILGASKVLGFDLANDIKFFSLWKASLGVYVKL